MNWDSSGSLRLSGTSVCTKNWDGWQRLVAVVQGMGKDFIPLTSGDAGDAGVARSTFLKASFLLDYNGGTSTFIYSAGGLGAYSAQVDDRMGGAPWTWNLGPANRKKFRVGLGWRRNFKAATVVVNPSPSQSQTFALGAAYLFPGGESAASITLLPGTAAILKRARR
jgi:hypothetical protein